MVHQVGVGGLEMGLGDCRVSEFAARMLRAVLCMIRKHVATRQNVTGPVHENCIRSDTHECC